MKYVGIDVTHGAGTNTELTKRLIVAFPDDLVHADVAAVMKVVARQSWPKAKVETGSAGFFTGRMDSTYGESTSLGGLKSDKDDATRFNMMDYGGNHL